MKSVNKKTAVKGKNNHIAVDARHLLEEQIAAFLQSGGQVQEIPNGVSGHTANSPRRNQISLGPKSSKPAR